MLAQKRMIEKLQTVTAGNVWQQGVTVSDRFEFSWE